MITRSSTKKKKEEQEKFRRDGFLILHDFLPRTEVEKAQATIKSLAALDESLLDRQDIANHPDVIHILEHEKILEWCSFHFSTIKEEASLCEELPVKYESHPTVFPIPYKWLRSVDNGYFTGPHFDSYYVGYGSPTILTFWIPLSNLPTPEHGLMSIVPGSHISKKHRCLRERYGRQDGVVGGDGTTSGWIPESELGGMKWITEPLMMGDVVVLSLDVLHKTLPNTSGVTRYSSDCRFQPTYHTYPPWRRAKKSAREE
jgi:hypothetical protein